MTKEEIKKSWDKNRDEAAEAGTKMHYDIECFYNDMDIEVEEDCLEWKYFEKFFVKSKSNFLPGDYPFFLNYWKNRYIHSGYFQKINESELDKKCL